MTARRAQPQITEIADLTFPIDLVRDQFASLSVTDDGIPRVYFDTPAGTQVPRHVIDRTSRYFVEQNANSGGYFRTAIVTDGVLEQAHEAMADLLGASSAAEIVFGQNMTSLTFAVSRSLGHQLSAGDEIILTRMDHDANVAPWLLLARDLGLTVRWLPFDKETFRFKMADLESLISSKTRIAAINYASNALGTINDVKSMCGTLADAEVLSYVDAVQLVPHRLADVQDLGCDFLSCSAYKFFGPHQGILWGRREHLKSLNPYKVRPASNDLPHRWETGTLSHEGMAGTLGAIEYLEWLAGEVEADGPNTGDRRSRLAVAMDAAERYERVLCRQLLDGLAAIAGVKIYGITAHDELVDRVPTVCITVDGVPPDEVAKRLAAANVFVWSGDYYAVEVIQHLGLQDAGGMVRIGLAHYHTSAEVERLLTLIDDLT